MLTFPQLDELEADANREKDWTKLKLIDDCRKLKANNLELVDAIDIVKAREQALKEEIRDCKNRIDTLGKKADIFKNVNSEFKDKIKELESTNYDLNNEYRDNKRKIKLIHQASETLLGNLKMLSHLANKESATLDQNKPELSGIYTRNQFSYVVNRYTSLIKSIDGIIKQAESESLDNEKSNEEEERGLEKIYQLMQVQARVTDFELSEVDWALIPEPQKTVLRYLLDVVRAAGLDE